MKFFKDYYLDYEKKLSILDIGAGTENLENGSYKPLFDSPNWKYYGLDMENGPNVDFVPKDIYNWNEIENESFDVIISGQVFEHIEFPWKTMKQIEKKLKPQGICCIIAPSSGPIHKAPKDCYRYNPDGLIALAKYVKFNVLNCSITNVTLSDYPWYDCVLIAEKSGNTPPQLIEFKFSFFRRFKNSLSK